jgi:hypothetical protein
MGGSDFFAGAVRGAAVRAGRHRIGATLYATAVEPAELDRVIEDLESLDGVQQAFWNAAAEE